MRRSHLVLVPLLAIIVAGCGNGSGGTETLSPAQAVRAAATSTAHEKSSKIEITTVATVGAQPVTIKAGGAFDYANHTGQMSLQLPGGTLGTIEERIVGGVVYIEIPNAKGTFYSLNLDDLVGTSFNTSTDPTSGLQALQGASSDVAKVGDETVRGAKTTHYKGTYDIKVALSKLSGAVKDALLRTFGSADLPPVPFDAYIDDQGRMRKLDQHLEITSNGQNIVTDTTLELYDFGTKVDVTAPPASQVKDGRPLLDALKGAGGTGTG
jgi:hypothetical protein